MLETKCTLDRLYESLARADEVLRGRSVTSDAATRDAVLADFRAGMDDDFNTARGLATVFDTMRALNRHIDAGELEKAAACRAALADIAGVLGIGGQDPRAYLAGDKARGLEASDLSAAEIERLIGGKKDG